jgi:hypothetical protein
MNNFEKALDKKKKHEHVKGKDDKCKICGKDMRQEEFIKDDDDNKK